jgi:hypothetical protein
MGGLPKKHPKPASRSTRLGIVSQSLGRSAVRSRSQHAGSVSTPATLARFSSLGGGCDPHEVIPSAGILHDGDPASACSSGDSAPRRAQTFHVVRPAVSVRKALGTLGDRGDPTLGSPPSLGNDFYASFLPPPPDHPDHRENARRDRLGKSCPDLEPIATAPNPKGEGITPTPKGEGITAARSGTPPEPRVARSDDARARRFSRVGPTRTQQRMQARGFSPAEWVRERAPTCTMLIF